MKKLNLKSSLGLEAIEESVTSEDAPVTTAAGEQDQDQSGEIEGGQGETEAAAEVEQEPTNNDEVQEQTDEADGEVEQATDDVIEAEGEADAGAAEAEQVAETVEEARIDGEAAEADLQEADQKADEAEEIAQESLTALNAAIGLESAAEALTAQMRAGNISNESVAYMMQNVNTAMRSIDEPAMSSFGLESADGADEKVGAATQMIATLKDYAKRIKEAIVAGLKKAVTVVTERLKSIFTAAGRTKARAEKLKEALKAADVKLQAVTSPRIAQGVMVVDNVSTNLVSDLGKVFTIAHGFIKPAIYSRLEKIAAGKDVEAMNTELKGLIGDWTNALGDTVTDGTEVRCKELTLGNVRYAFNAPKDAESINTLGAKVSTDEGAKAVDKPMRELKINEAVGAVDLIIKGLTEMEKLRNDPAFKAVEKAVMGNVNKITDKIEDPGVFKKILNTLLRLVSSTISLPSTVFAATAVRQSSRALDWIQASIVTPTVGERVNAAKDAAKAFPGKVAAGAKAAPGKIADGAKAVGAKVSGAATALKSKLGKSA